MGTWGTGISSNDIFEDLNIEFFDLYNEGKEVCEITEILIQQNQELINSDEDYNNFWIALAKFQWECKSLNSDVYLKVKKIIESGNDIKLWKELGASNSDLKKREKVLLSFLEKISEEKKKPRRRKNKLENKLWGGAFVLEEENNTELGLNYLAITDINKSEKPTLNDFKESEILVEKWKENVAVIKEGKPIELKEEINEYPVIKYYHAEFYKKFDLNIELIGNLKIKKEYDSKKCKFGGQWHHLKSSFVSYNKHIELYGKPSKKLKLSFYLKKYWL
jgi:hypothetical protein